MALLLPLLLVHLARQNVTGGCNSCSNHSKHNQQPQV
jgi:hypothetical protein